MTQRAETRRSTISLSTQKTTPRLLTGIQVIITIAENVICECWPKVFGRSLCQSTNRDLSLNQSLSRSCLGGGSCLAN